MKDDLSRTPVEYDRPRNESLFLWTVFLLLLVGFSMACWIGSYVIFSRPELPISYKILRKIKKIDNPIRFKVNAAPAGEFLTAEKLFERYNKLSGGDLRELNRELERSYLRNYPAASQQAAYVTGRFTILKSYELSPTDFFRSGVVALASSKDFPKLLIEHVYTTSPTIAPLVQRNLQTGMDLELRRTYDLTAVVHVTKLPDGRIQLTVVPLNYGSYAFTGTNGGFTLDPPDDLRVAAGWPIVREERREEASQAFVAFRQKSGLDPLVSSRVPDSAKTAQSALKGVDTPVAEIATPAPSVAPTPVVAARSTPGKPGAKKPLVAAANVPVAKALPVEPTPAPKRATPPPQTVVKSGAPAQNLGGGVSLQPFLSNLPAASPGPAVAAAPAVPAANGPSRTWPTYQPGKMPSGKNVQVDDIATLSHGGALSGEPVYLSGEFVVRAVGENKARGVRNAVLRSSSNTNVRVIVEYPGDRPLPLEGAEISRDEQRPYLITDVRQVADGTLNVFAREITQ